MELKQKNVLVVGTGISGIAATKLLNKLQCKVTLLDSNVNLNIESVTKQLPKNCIPQMILGDLPKEKMDDYDYIVLSPGVPTDLPFIEELREKRIPIIGEIELAYYFEKGKVAAITGTNGKTTTTSLIGTIMRCYYEQVLVVGNIGLPYTERVTETTKKSVTVAELSSFQLETIDLFCPKVSAILNITPDHLNRHHTMENYMQAKFNIAKNQTKEETCVLNYEDSALREFGEQLNCNVVYFSSERVLKKGLYLAGEEIMYSDGINPVSVCNIHELNIIGKHNYENAMVGIAVAINMEVPMEYIRKGLKEFVAVEHRIEFVKEIKGVKYYNDSKGTNPDAAIKAVQAMRGNTILIGGGYDKENEYDEWVETFPGRVRYLILLGQTKEKIADCAKKHGFHNIVMVETLEEAVRQAAELAKPGENVLLSPACASWGMFKNYEQRGEMFKEYVMQLEQR